MSLREAVETGDLERVHEVLAQGADPNNVDGDGTPPLHIAASAGNAELAGVLLASGAVVDLPEANDGATALHVAARYGHHDTVQTLLVYGANVGATTNGGITPLHMAAQAGHSRVIELLLASGADPEQAETEAGRTALHLSATEGHHDAARLLIWSGADPNRGDNAGLTALILASANGHVEAVQTLLMQGANVNMTDQNGETPLMVAINEQHDDIALLLLEQGADANAQESRSGMTPLHFAAMAGREALVAPLLERGADLAITDSSGATALDAAEMAGHPQIVELLREEQNRSNEPAAPAAPAPATGKPQVFRLSPEATTATLQRPAPSPQPQFAPAHDVHDTTEVITPVERRAPPATQAQPRRARRKIAVPRSAIAALMLAVVAGGAAYLWFTNPEAVQRLTSRAKAPVEAPPPEAAPPQLAPGAIPAIKGPINDYAGILDKNSRKEIGALIEDARKKAGVELAVVTVDTTKPAKAQEFARQTAEAWQKGDAAYALLVVAASGEVAIHTSAKVRSLLPANKAAQLIKDEIAPALARRDYRAGLVAGTRAIKRTLSKEPDKPDKPAVARTTESQPAPAPRPTAATRGSGGYLASIRSTPPGAIAIIDRGTYVGQTPLDLQLPYGRHMIEIRMPGYVTQRERIWVSQNSMTYSFDLVPVLD